MEVNVYVLNLTEVKQNGEMESQIEIYPTRPLAINGMKTQMAQQIRYHKETGRDSISVDWENDEGAGLSTENADHWFFKIEAKRMTAKEWFVNPPIDSSMTPFETRRILMHLYVALSLKELYDLMICEDLETEWVDTPLGEDIMSSLTDAFSSLSTEVSIHPIEAEIQKLDASGSVGTTVELKLYLCIKLPYEESMTKDSINMFLTTYCETCEAERKLPYSHQLYSANGLV